MQLVNHQYQIQGLNLTAICQEFGTPLYIYDADTILEKIQSLRTAFSGLPLRLKYAAKALTNISILKLMKSQQVGIDVVSIQEARLGLMAGFEPHEIMFTPNGVSFQEMQEAVELGINLGIDNLPMLEYFGQQYADTLSCSLRLNPHIVAGGNAKIQVGHINSKFGISISQLSQILDIVNKYNIKIAGLHIHTGSDLKDADVFLQTAAILFDAAMQFKHLRFINFGGGFKVAYKKGDHTTNIHELGAKLKDAFLAFCDRYGRNLEIWFEPGKFLVSEAGLLLVKTNVVKKAPTTVFVQVDSGMNHLVRPMMYDAYHDMVNISNPDGEHQEYTVVGYICETDTLGANRELNEVREGDIIAIKNAGAYGFSMSSNYNSRLRPAEVMIYKGQAKLIRKREELEDLIKNQVVADWGN